MNNDFVEFVRADGTIEYRHKNYDDLISQPVVAPIDYIKIPEEEIKQWEDTQYQRNRVLEYPSIGDQLDALFKAGVFPEEMAAQIQAVKDKYPKPTE